uniref:Uncharacterized protein n=1 Tax=Arundo donax TaxID=35708 RepID=A0A0A9G341_ARUDO
MVACPSSAGSLIMDRSSTSTTRVSSNGSDATNMRSSDHANAEPLLLATDRRVRADWKPSCTLTRTSKGSPGGGAGTRRSCASMTDARRYQSLGDWYTLERVYAAYGASVLHASGNASSACVPIHTATMMSPVTAPGSPPSSRYHCGASGPPSGCSRTGTSERSKQTPPRKASAGEGAPPSHTEISSVGGGCSGGLPWLMANTWFHSGLPVPETSRPGRDRSEWGPAWTFT